MLKISTVDFNKCHQIGDLQAQILYLEEQFCNRLEFKRNHVNSPLPVLLPGSQYPSLFVKESDSIAATKK